MRATNAEGTGSWSDSGSGTTDANAAPAFSSSATFDAAENQTTAGTVTATDSDSEDDIEGYALTGGADQSFFSIGATDGALTFKADPNFEDAKDIVSVDPANAAGNNQYVVVVTATSGTDTRVKTATQTITVTVTDDDTEKPGTPAAPNVSAASVTSLTVNWSAPANAGPAITDYDVRYREGTGGSWTDGNHTGTAVTATLSGLSENTSHQVQVRATNAEGTGSWSDAGSGTTDANAAPAFSSSATFDAAENQTTAGTVLATDSDSEDDITGYALTGGADQTFFSIGATDGALTFKAAPNFEDAKDIVSVDPANAAGNNQYVVVVTATSGTDTRVKTATQTITVTVTDDDTEKPGTPAAPNVSAASVTSLTVNWSAPANTGPAITDYDVRYRAGTSGSWTDGNHTGTAVTATLSSLSENTSHQVQVRATNAEGTGSWSDSGSGTTDANAAPAFSSSATFDAAENQTTAGTVTATDSDSEDDIEGYALTGGADQSFFSIGATDGALTFKAAPNFEDAKDIVSVDPANAAGNNQYVVVVTATSGTDTRVKTATQTITVTVTDDDTEKPGTPAAPNVSAASVTSLTVNWSAPANTGPAITDYDVQYRAGTSGSWTDGNHTGTAVTATLSSLSENTSHQVQVRATNAEGTGSWSDSGSGTTDANAAPAFSSSATFDAAENQTTAGTVTATDSDSEDDIEGYALTGGADQTFFSIGATDGALTFKAAPNFEDAKDIVSVDPANAAGNNQYVVVVTATSGTDTRVKTATQTITVTVTDDDTEKPGTPAAPNVSAASVTSLTVNWSAPANTGPAITDYDVQYRAGTSGSWTDGNHTGTAVTATLSGLSENTSHQVQVRATNAEGTGSWSDSGSGTTDANAAPAFSSSATFDAAENQTTAGTVLATDSDSEDDITGYALTGGADQTFFSIGATDGALTFKAAPNFEDAKDIVSVDPANAAGNNQYVVVVTATSGTDTRVKTATQTITVTVTDVAGEAPGKPAAPTVSPASVTSLTVTWTAPANTGPAITDYDYRHRTTSPQGTWTEVTGTTITTLSSTIGSLAENTSYDVQVRATNDEGTGSWSDSGSGATDANAAPAFSSSATFDAAENQTAAGTVLAADSDTGDDITGYAITGGADQSFFSIGATDGALTFKAAPNFEDAKDIVSVDPANAAGNNQYVVVVTATSGTDTRVKTATQTITVTVTDDDTEKPGTPAAPNVSAASVTSLTVNWSAPANAGPAITDYDVQYREGTGGSWTDGNHTGTAVTATLSGLSENTSHQVQVRATNAEGTGSWSDAGSGTTDANAAPAFSSSATFDAAENQTTAGTVTATDSDSEDDIEGYALTGGADQSFFSIGATDGALTFKAAPNFEDAKDIVSVDPANAAGNNQYVVVVTATSGTDTRVKTATQTITVTVTDVAGEAPGKPAAPTVSPASVTSLTVTWTAPANTGPAITDYDYRHRTTSPQGTWTEVTGTTITTLSSTIGSLAENTSYDVQVRATNDEGTGSWSDSGSGATDANAAPAFSSSATFDAAENQTAAGTVLAADSDTGDDITGYAITGGADQSCFSIGATDGALTFKAAPNFEDAKDIVSVDPANAAGNNQYVVVVTATSGTDTRVKTATQTITVTVTDDDTEKPGTPAAPNVSAASVTSLTVNWSAPANAGPAITDYDVQYREGTGGSWTDGNHTGTAVTATLSGLSENTSHQVQVRATNAEGTGSWSDAGSGTTDANAAPAFSSSATFDAAENQTTAGTVTATDSDSEDDIEGYALTGGADQSFFSIGATDGALTFKAAPNFEDAKDIVSVDPANAAGNNQYVVVVTATSGTDTRVKTATQTITVTVTDVAGEAPGKPAAPTVSPASVTSLTVTWTAPANAGPAIDDYDVRYREGTGGSWSDGGHTGAATTATLSSLSENTSYQVQVRATNDEGMGSWSDSGSGRTDANAAPSFSSSATFSMAENGTEVAMVMASDSDSEDKIERYDITGGADQAFFLVIASSGHLEFRDAPNYEDAEDQGSNNTYVVEVQATSGTGTRVKTATQTITVTVTDVAGEAPGKPNAPTVSPASVTSLTVTWSAPANAGPAITGYDVRYREGTGGSWTDGNHTGAARTATLSSLAENTSYQVQVRATNDEGTGSWSDSGSGRTDANAAPPPQDLQAEAGSSTSVTVTWRAPDGGPAITGYDVQYRAGDSGSWSNWGHTGTATTATITGLEANTAYQVQVRALSAMGPSPWTALANVRTAPPPEGSGICDRTPRVRDRILVLLKNRHSYKGDCSGVTGAQLARLESLDLGRNPSTESPFTMSLRRDDFEGLVNLERLYMRETGLRSLPAGVFDGLTSLEELELDNNRLRSLPPGVFSDLRSLESLKLRKNPSLESLPYDEFEALPELSYLRVDLEGRRKLQVAGGEGDASLEVAAGGTATYRVRLMATTNARAANPVTVTVSSDVSAVTASPETVSFTRENWFRRQTVTVRAAASASGTTAKLTHAADGAYYAYDRWPLPGVTVTVVQSGQSGDAAGLTAEFEGLPREGRGGETAFSFRIVFSEDVATSADDMRDHAFQASGGAVRDARRLRKGSNRMWEMTVKPNSNGPVTITLPATTDCGADGAICTGDGRPLSHALSAALRGPAGTMEQDRAARLCSALAGGDDITPATVAAALWGDGDMSDDRLAALDSLGNGNGSYDLGDLLAWIARCRRGEGPGSASGGTAPPFPPPALPASRTEGGASRRRRGRAAAPASRRKAPAPPAAGSRTRRFGWLRTALLTALISASGCGLGDGIVGPRADAPRHDGVGAAVVDPGPLHVRLTAPPEARDIGAMLVIEGPAIDSLQAPGLEMFETGESSSTRREVIIAGALPPDGPLLRLWVPHRGDQARYRIRLLQVAGEDFTLRDLTAYGTAISR